MSRLANKAFTVNGVFVLSYNVPRLGAGRGRQWADSLS